MGIHVRQPFSFLLQLFVHATNNLDLDSRVQNEEHAKIDHKIHDREVEIAPFLICERII
jgi:hypothetical protein